MKVNPTEKGTEKFMMLKRKTCSGLYEDILNSYKALSYKNEWSLFFCNHLITFSDFKVSWIGPELRLGAEFSHAAVTTGNLTSVSKQHRCLVAIPKNVGADPIRGDKGFQLCMGFWWMILWKWGGIRAGKFICHQIKIVTEINILEKTKR